ncbi:TRAP transporter small permease [Streptomyces winkii]|uniref:TRAP transporter small permease n=1 Tax=Streptomyces winkii TaxID=3051178 RepID=UPI0028D02114|nr:TRAP transporter small permease [Streptomyces sp. DSM 40971]
MNALNTLRKYLLACSTGMAVVAMAVIGLMTVTITYDVVVRFAFSAPTDWAYPLNSAGVLASTSLAVPYFYAKGAHISMDLVHRAMAPGLRRASDLVAAGATAFVGLVLCVTAFRATTVAIDSGLTGSGTFSIPLWVPDALLSLTGAVLVLVAVLFPPGGPSSTSDAAGTGTSAPDATAPRVDGAASGAGEGEAKR